jgi:hypothetical protein
MVALSDVALSVAVQLGRANSSGTSILALETEIKSQIAETIRHYNRRPWHLFETRDLVLTTVAGTRWYSSVDPSASEGEEDNTGRASIPVSDILSIDYIRETSSAIEDYLHEMRYADFERMFAGSTPGGWPISYARYAGRLGIYPEPDAVYTIQMSASVKPQIPTADADESVWFDKANELIEAGTCARVCLKYLRDRERAAEYAQVEEGAAAALHSEHIRKTSTGRLRCHD